MPESAAEYVDPKTLKPWPRNPRKKDQAQVDRVAASITKIGVFGAPIVARSATREVIAGHTRLAAALKLKLKQVPVRFVDLDEEHAHQLALADNKLAEHGEWDDGELEAQLAQMDAETKQILGFEDPKNEDSLEVEEIDLSELEEKRFCMSIEGPLPQQPEALEVLRDALEKIPGVVVHFAGIR